MPQDSVTDEPIAMDGPPDIWFGEDFTSTPTPQEIICISEHEIRNCFLVGVLIALVMVLFWHIIRIYCGYKKHPPPPPEPIVKLRDKKSSESAKSFGSATTASVTATVSAAPSSNVDSSRTSTVKSKSGMSDDSEKVVRV
ncbi:hypothetical protein ACQ4LE_005702 [Meloidogyne hapla]